MVAAISFIALVSIIPVAGGAENENEAARLARGVKVRAVLLQLIEIADRAGSWPQQPGSLANELGLVYLKPDAVATEMRVLTVVVHEQLHGHPDGVWVGYADGHLEFASSAAELAQCKEQINIANGVIAKAGALYPEPPGLEVDQKAVAQRMKGTLTLKIVDPKGRPVAGAQVGSNAHFGDETPAEKRVRFDEAEKLVSGVDGLVKIPVERVFDLKQEGWKYVSRDRVLYVLQQERGLVALEKFTANDFGDPDGKADTRRVREVRLQPACRVWGQVSSVGSTDPAQKLTELWVGAFKPGEHWIRGVSSQMSRPEFELELPPGEYAIRISSEHHEYVHRYIRIEPGQREYRLAVDVEPQMLPQSLFGKPAPELRSIKGWKNGGPVTLGELRGKVVLLDFWGTWCGPCIGDMPKVMKLHDKFKDRGLVVIAVHDDSVASIAEMDSKLEKIRKDCWNGRDLPFLVALDGGGSVRVAGTGKFLRGATTAEYFINGFPTTLLVGRDGKVAGELELLQEKGLEEAEAAIEKLLTAEPRR